MTGIALVFRRIVAGLFLRVMSETHIPVSVAQKNPLDTASRSKYQKSGWTLPSIFPLPNHQGQCCVGRLIGQDTSSLRKEVGSKAQSNIILKLTKEIEELYHENNLLNEESFAADFDYMNLLERLECKENELDDLKTEINQLSNQITLSNSKEQHYFVPNELCENLEGQIRTLQEQLILQRKDFEHLTSIHAACPSPHEIISAIDQAKSVCETQLKETIDHLSARDELIADLEMNITKKDVELQKITVELFQQQADYCLKDQTCKELQQQVASMEHVIEERERMIENMGKLVVRKNGKLKLLQKKCEDLDKQLHFCKEQLREVRKKRSLPLKCQNVGCFDSKLLERNPWSTKCVRNASNPNVQCYWSCEEENVITKGDSDTSLTSAQHYEEKEQWQYDTHDKDESKDYSLKKGICTLPNKIGNIRAKILIRLENEIQKEAEIRETLKKLRCHLDQVQSGTGQIRQNSGNCDLQKDLSKPRLSRERSLYKIIESSERDRRIAQAKIISLEKALKNLKDLEQFISRTEILHRDDD